MPAAHRSYGWVLVALLVLAGCAGTDGGVDGPVIEGAARNGGTAAIVSGTVVLERDCIYLDGPHDRYPVVWPPGTSWRTDEEAVELPDGTLVRAGDRISGAGGFHQGTRLETYTNAEGVTVARRCVDNTHGNVAVFNSSDDIEVGS